MKLNDFTTEEKVRLDPKCWTGKKIGNPKTKMKGGVRVNNCVPKEGQLNEFAPGGSEGNGPFEYGSAIITIGQDFVEDYQDAAAGEDAADIIEVGKTFMSAGMKAGIAALFALDTQVYDYVLDQLSDQGFNVDLDITSKRRAPVVDKSTQNWYQSQQDKINAQAGDVYLVTGHHEFGTTGNKIKASSPEEAKQKFIAQHKMKFTKVDVKPQGVAEEYNPEYDDEAGMADNNLETLKRTVAGIDDLIDSGDNLPEWCQEKIAVAKGMLVAVWDYMYSEEASDEVDPEVDAMFEAMDQLAEEMSRKHRVSVDTVWETFESLPDNVLYETAAWRRKEGKSKSGGLNAKGVASYRRENPGSKLQTAVTTKPSKLKPGSKAAKRRKSFCARMSGVKGPMKKPNGKPTRKALALRKWNC